MNARIADRLVWQRIAELMGSPQLLLKQLDRWTKAQNTKVKSSVGDIEAVEKEITKLQIQEGRYNSAYGAGLFSMDQLKEYTVPIRERIVTLKIEVAEDQKRRSRINSTSLPSQTELKALSEKAFLGLKSLSFGAKRAIVMNIVEKIVGTENRLQVYGYIPLTTNHVEFITSDRNCRSAKCREVHII